MACGCSWAATSDASFIPLEEFLPDIKVVAPSVPDEMAANAARLAAIELTGAIPFVRRNIILDAQQGVVDYFLDLPDDYRISRVHTVTLDGRPVPASTRSAFGGQWFHYDRAEQRIVLRQPPAKDGPGCIVVEVTVTPGQRSCQLPSELYHDALDVIASGALARLLLTPGASWTNLTTAGVYRKMYIEGRERVSNLVLRGGISGPLTMRARRFF
jgi:hypothetical protein